MASFHVRLASLVAVAAFTTPALACPFCDATSPTWLQSIAESEAAVLARVASVDEGPVEGQEIPLARVTYAITDVLRGKEVLGTTRTLHGESLEAPAVGTTTLLTAVGSPELSWTPLTSLTGERAAYLAEARRLPATGIERWKFFYRYLEHDDEALAADAYGEFAVAPFAEVKAFAAHASREQLWQWIESDKTPESRRGLYYTMLSVCGQPADAARLKAMLAAPDQRPPGAFSALVSCYISLCGEEALCEIEQQFLANSHVSEADAQGVIVALRFHGEEQHVFRRERIASSLRLVLDRPHLAVSVIPDLARWEDWESMPTLVELFRRAEPEATWVRIPIVAYLRACPLESAARHLETLKTIDPQAVEQAEALSLFGTRLRGK